MKKRIVSFFLAVMMLLQTTTVFGAVGLEGFTDYHQDLGYGQLSTHWAKENIAVLLEKGAIHGYPEGDFRANKEISAAELIAILLQVTGNTRECAEENWAEGMLQIAYEMDLCQNGQIALEEAAQPLSREKMAILLVNSAEKLNYEDITDLHMVSAKSISDLQEAHPFYQNAIIKAYSMGLIAGDRWGYAPKKSTTRAEAAAIVNRLMRYTERIDAVKAEEERLEWMKNGRPAMAGVDFTIDLSFIGDCLLATDHNTSYTGAFREYAEKKPASYFLEKAGSVLQNDDFTIANMENVLTDRDLKPIYKDHSPAFWFKGPSKNAAILKEGSVEIVSLSNNHFGDYGDAGRLDTMKALDAAGLAYGKDDKVVYFEKNGFRIALICHGLWWEGQSKQIIAKMQEAAKWSDYQIVYFHGGTERLHAPEQWKVREAHKLVDAGADLVIGNHPHVLQPTEVYKDTHILYSLGNFCFGGNRKPENRTIIYKAILGIKEKQVVAEQMEVIPCVVYTGEINNWQPAILDEGEAKQLVLDFMAGKRSAPF